MQLTLPILIGIALADSINPVSFGVLIKLLDKYKKSDSKILDSKAWEYIASYLSTYVGTGVVMMMLFSILGNIQPGFYSFLGAVVFILGLLELNRITNASTQLKRFTSDPVERIETYTKNFGQEPGANLALGMNTALREIGYTGGFYLGLAGLLALNGSVNDTYVFLFLYNAVIAVPLIIIFQLVKNNKSFEDFQLWKPGSRKPMMLGIASLQVVLGIWLMFWWFV